jgi:hypothetical protein
MFPRRHRRASSVAAVASSKPSTSGLPWPLLTLAIEHTVNT